MTSTHTKDEATPADTHSRYRISAAIVRGLGNNWTFVAILVLAVIQSLVIAFTAGYPLLYDEKYHLGLIKLFAAQGTPFVSEPQRHRGFGDLTDFGSFLFAYVMAAPYALTRALGLDAATRLTVLRTISALLAASALIWFRKTLRFSGISPATTNASLLIFVSLPVVPFLAATINYDNLMLPLGAAFLWYGVRAMTAERLNPRLLIVMLALGCLASLTTFLFLPVFAAGMIIVVVRQLFKLRKSPWRDRLEPLGKRDLRSPSFWVSAVAAATALYFFVAIYVGSLVRFGTPVPDCARLNSIAYCGAWPPWARNYALLHNGIPKPDAVRALPDYVLRDWIPGQFNTLAFVGSNGHEATVNPTIVLLQSFALVAALVLLLTFGALWKSSAVKFLSITAIAAFIVLFVVNYNDYVTLGEPLGIQARYLLLFAPFVIAFSAAGLARISNLLHANSPAWKIGLLVIAIIPITQMGGALDYFAAANPGWFTPAETWLGRFGPEISLVVHHLSLVL